MHISTKTGYAVRALAELASKPANEPISIAELCKTQNLPRKYVEQLFRKLKKNEIIKSIHGAKGGYLLQKSTSDISLMDIMLAVEEQLAYTYCDPEKTDHDYCVGSGCGFQKIWDEINHHMEDYFSSIKLDQILAKLGE